MDAVRKSSESLRATLESNQYFSTQLQAYLLAKRWELYELIETRKDENLPEIRSQLRLLTDIDRELSLTTSQPATTANIVSQLTATDDGA